MSKKEEESVNDNLAFSDAADESHVDEQTVGAGKDFHWDEQAGDFHLGNSWYTHYIL